MEPDEDHLLAFDQLLREIDDAILEARRYRAAATPECLEFAKLKILQVKSLAGIAFHELRYLYYKEGQDNDDVQP